MRSSRATAARSRSSSWRGGPSARRCSPTTFRPSRCRDARGRSCVGVVVARGGVACASDDDSCASLVASLRPRGARKARSRRSIASESSHAHAPRRARGRTRLVATRWGLTSSSPPRSSPSSRAPLLVLRSFSPVSPRVSFFDHSTSATGSSRAGSRSAARSGSPRPPASRAPPRSRTCRRRSSGPSPRTRPPCRSPTLRPRTARSSESSEVVSSQGARRRKRGPACGVPCPGPASLRSRRVVVREQAGEIHKRRGETTWCFYKATERSAGCTRNGRRRFLWFCLKTQEEKNQAAPGKVTARARSQSTTAPTAKGSTCPRISAPSQNHWRMSRAPAGRTTYWPIQE